MQAPPRPRLLHRVPAALLAAVVMSAPVAGVLVAAPPAHAAFLPVDLVIDDAVADEGAGSIEFTVRVQRNGSDVEAPGDINFTYSTVDGTAVAPGDYTAATPTQETIPSGASRRTITIATQDDVLDEDDETFTVQISSSDFLVTVRDSQATGTINDDDDEPEMSIGNAQAVTEGDSGTVTTSFPVTLSVESGRIVTVDYATADGTAVAPGDYTAGAATFTFLPGEIAKSIEVDVMGDTLDEDDETFTMTLSSPTNVTLGASDAAAAITDDDAEPVLSIGDAGAISEGEEGTSTATFPVTLSAPSGRAVTVDYATVDGTAVAPGDYAVKTGTVTFTTGETSKNVTVLVKGDALDEDDEAFTVALSSPTNVTLGTATGAATITDDDASPTVSIGNTTVIEGNSGTVTASFPVTLSKASGRIVTVNYATADGTAAAPADYTATSTGTLTFAPGETVKYAEVAVKGDALDEDNETFTVTLSLPSNSALGASTGTGTITDDDDEPQISIDDTEVWAWESGGPIVFSVSLSAPSGRTVTAAYYTGNDTAWAGSDYVATAGTLTFAPGETTKTVSVDLIDNAAEESDYPIRFWLQLGTITNASGWETIGYGYIFDDEVPWLTIEDAEPVTEGNSGTQLVSVTLQLSGPSTRAVTAWFTTGDGSAVAPDDYAAVNNSITFPPGTTEQQIGVTVKGDTIDEDDEFFGVVLWNIENAYAWEGEYGLITILDDDEAQSSPPSSSWSPPASSTTPEGPPSISDPAPAPQGAGFVLDAVGGVHAFGSAQYQGSLPGRGIPTQVIDMAVGADGTYYVLDAVGGVHVFGPGQFYGSLPGRGIPTRVVAIDVAPDGTYYVLDAVGGVHVFGPGEFYGSMPGRGIPSQVIDLAVGDDGTYYVLDAVGGVHVFGPGQFYGSLPGRGIPTQVVAIDAGPDGTYYVLDAVGGVHVFGPGEFYGSLPGRGNPTKVVDLAVDPRGGYAVLDANGNLHKFGGPVVFGGLRQRGITAAPVALVLG